jgi:CubicO group peptidase (beta-lactamase class C family)/putative intracellular protease/amidase/DNA-directed RNA polymerase subunit RPC12/RpoP
MALLACALPPGTGARSDNGTGAAQPTDRIRRIENGLPAVSTGDKELPVQLTLQDVMALYKVPGLSVAVIDDFKIAWAKGYGVTEAGGNVAATPRTLFQAGSVSKPVAAVGALALVEQGKLHLDEDVNARLKSWRVPENEFTRQQKVTLRRILSHTAGLTVHFFPGYTVGEPVPSLVQVLDGAKPANTAPVRVDRTPGGDWHYSGGGTLVEQQLMIDVTGKPFPELMKGLVFDKLGMNDSTYEQPLPAARAAQAASGTYANGTAVRGKWHVYPEMAAGGLWTTPSDLARLAIEVALSRQGKANRVLSADTAHEMLKPQFGRVREMSLGNRQHPDAMGLGWFLGGPTRPAVFGHIGDDAGFQAMCVMSADAGQGVVVMANSANGILIGDYLADSIATEYHWDWFLPTDRPRVGAGAVLMAVCRSKGTEAALRSYADLKKRSPPRFAPDRETLNRLAYWLRGEDKLADALKVAKRAVEENPDYWNAYDTLGEMYLQAGDRKLAEQNYEKSVTLNPGNRSGVRALEGLKEARREAEAGGPARKKVYVCTPCGLDCDKLTFDKPGACPHCGMPLVLKPEGKPVSVAILLFNGVEIIDYTGPWEVFGQAGFDVHAVAESLKPVKTTFGQRVLPDYTFENCPPADVVLIPGGGVTDELLANAKVVGWIRTAGQNAKHVMSVCTGAFLLGKAGLLDGQTATTFHNSIDGLTRFAPKTKVVYDQRFVDNGKVITTAGLTSGIDGALHVVSRILGQGEAQATALGLEYRWEPESQYARAAFADRYLPRFAGLERKTLAVSGDREHWEIRWLVSDPGSAREILEVMRKQIVSGTPHTGSVVTVFGPQAKDAGDATEMNWKFTDDQGRGWRGSATAEPSREEKGRYHVRLRLARD